MIHGGSAPGKKQRSTNRPEQEILCCCYNGVVHLRLGGHSQGYRMKCNVSRLARPQSGGKRSLALHPSNLNTPAQPMSIQPLHQDRKPFSCSNGSFDRLTVVARPSLSADPAQETQLNEEPTRIQQSVPQRYTSEGITGRKKHSKNNKRPQYSRRSRNGIQVRESGRFSRARARNHIMTRRQAGF